MASPRRLQFALIMLCLGLGPAVPMTIAEEPCGNSLTLDSLVHMSREELEALYRGANPGPIPEGYTEGRAFSRAGTCLAASSTKMTALLWHGKIFDGCSGTLQNQWCCGIVAVEAKVCYGESWLDGCPAIVMDYRGVSHLVWRHVRDELRQIGPCLYLGAMFQEKHGCPQFKMFFALETSCCCPEK